MRWRPRVISHGIIRTVRRFLWLPRFIEGEWRWLERASIRQMYIVGLAGNRWEDQRWIDDSSVTTEESESSGEESSDDINWDGQRRTR